MRLTIQEASKRLDIPPQALREWLKKGAPFGLVVHEMKQRNGRRTYYINEERLNAYLNGQI